jgi:group II intron reverse transcriptase/maturase
VDKVYKRKNLELAWKRVKRNKGAGGIDGQTLAEFEEQLDVHLDRLHEELKNDAYRPLPVRRKLIPKAGQPGKYRPLGIPAIYDRVCQQALKNRLEPIFEPLFDDASFGYRLGRSTKDALRKIWQEIEEGYEWIVDADLSDFFGSADHEKLLTLVAQRVSDGRVLRLIRSMLKAGCMAEGKRLPTEQGTPQGGVVSPILSNVLLTPFDREMRHRGYRLTRYADDWIVACRTRAEAQEVLAEAEKILRTLGVTLNRAKTRIVHVARGFEFLGYKIKRGSRPLALSSRKIRTGVRQGDLYAYPRQKSTQHFKDQIRRRPKTPSSQPVINLKFEEMVPKDLCEQCLVEMRDNRGYLDVGTPFETTGHRGPLWARPFGCRRFGVSSTRWSARIRSTTTTPPT